ncbi:hypothetical protein [Pseudomonas chlororaphis]|uniref:hypothetical protein n=1 Tax=Pseudomonas chlororaphis TaxID=587753 RepID=UPI00131A566E|nr:hypothetical protein [Pseudomonas chlororaphis]
MFDAVFLAFPGSAGTDRALCFRCFSPLFMLPASVAINRDIASIELPLSDDFVLYCVVRNKIFLSSYFPSAFWSFHFGSNAVPMPCPGVSPAGAGSFQLLIDPEVAAIPPGRMLGNFQALR